MMNNVYKHPTWWQNNASTQPPEPPDMALTERVAHLEQDVATIKTDIAVIKSNYATKEDLAKLSSDIHKAMTEQTRWVIIAMATLIAITTAIQKIIPAPVDRVASSHEQPVNSPK
jgi:hypothetical protein